MVSLCAIFQRMAAFVSCKFGELPLLSQISTHAARVGMWLCSSLCSIRSLTFNSLISLHGRFEYSSQCMVFHELMVIE